MSDSHGNGEYLPKHFDSFEQIYLVHIFSFFVKKNIPAGFGDV
jgi:hypothetical protein